MAAALLSLLVAAVVYAQGATQPLWYALLPVWMLLRMALNAVDGMLAREFGQQSRLGAYLNELSDVVGRCGAVPEPARACLALAPAGCG